MSDEKISIPETCEKLDHPYFSGYTLRTTLNAESPFTQQMKTALQNGSYPMSLTHIDAETGAACGSGPLPIPEFTTIEVSFY